MNTKYTPGPWFITSDDVIAVKENDRIKSVAYCVSGPMFEKGESEANAKIIEAAPSMLELLQWITKVTNNPEIGIKCDAIIKQATE